jgi:ABC-2 type transport system permease protein
MMIRPILTLAAGELRLVSKERQALIWILVMPIAFIYLFGRMMGGGGGPVKTALTVVDRDRTFLSGAFLENLRGEGFVLRNVSPDSAGIVQSIRTVTVPLGFSDSLAAGNRVAVRMEMGKNSGSDRDMTAEVHIQKAIVRTLAVLAEIDTAEVRPMLPVQDAGFQQHFREMSARPPVVEVSSKNAGRGKAVPSGFAASAPAMLVLFMLVNTVIYSALLLTQEKQTRCLARLASQPVSRFGLLTGKLLGRLALAMGQSVILLIAGRLMGVYWGPSPVGLFLLLVCLGLACASLGMMIGAVLRTPEQAGAVGWILPLFLSAIGGCWWPLEVVPHWMQVAGHISPAAWAMGALHGLISFGRGGEVVIVPCLVLLGYTAVFLAVGARKLRME